MDEIKSEPWMSVRVDLKGTPTMKKLRKEFPCAYEWWLDVLTAAFACRQRGLLFIEGRPMTAEDIGLMQDSEISDAFLDRLVEVGWLVREDGCLRIEERQRKQYFLPPSKRPDYVRSYMADYRSRQRAQPSDLKPLSEPEENHVEDVRTCKNLSEDVRICKNESEAVRPCKQVWNNTTTTTNTMQHASHSLSLSSARARACEGAHAHARPDDIDDPPETDFPDGPTFGAGRQALRTDIPAPADFAESKARSNARNEMLRIAAELELGGPSAHEIREIHSFLSTPRHKNCDDANEWFVFLTWAFREAAQHVRNEQVAALQQNKPSAIRSPVAVALKRARTNGNTWMDYKGRSRKGGAA